MNGLRYLLTPIEEGSDCFPFRAYSTYSHHVTFQFITPIMYLRKMNLALLVLFGFLLLAFASQPSPCVKVHLIVARQSTSWPGEGRMKELADHIKQQLPSSDSEALQYPAYGDIWRYRSSVFTGDKAMVTAITTYTSRCPDSKIGLLGYSPVRY